MERAPRISCISWGRIEVEGYGTFKDVKVYPGGVREWDWNETGTRHSHGIQPADVQELLDHGAQTIILGTGFYERLEVQPETLRMLENRGITVYARQSEEAAQRFQSSEGAVGALIHSTC